MNISDDHHANGNDVSFERIEKYNSRKCFRNIITTKLEDVDFDYFGQNHTKS